MVLQMYHFSCLPLRCWIQSKSWFSSLHHCRDSYCDITKGVSILLWYQQFLCCVNWTFSSHPWQGYMSHHLLLDSKEKLPCDFQMLAAYFRLMTLMRKQTHNCKVHLTASYLLILWPGVEMPFPLDLVNDLIENIWDCTPDVADHHPLRIDQTLIQQDNSHSSNHLYRWMSSQWCYCQIDCRWLGMISIP